MTVLDPYRDLFAYTEWADALLLAELDQVAPERLHESLGGSSFDSMFGTAAHVLQGEIYYFHLWTRRPQPTERRPMELRTLPELRQRWTEQRQLLDEFMASVTPDQLDEVVHYKTRDGAEHDLAVGRIMLNMVNHGTHHRAELCDLLSRAGSPPPATDFIVFTQVRARA
ncbi:MAG: DinB family protein [Chloroflexi bacterium]|nr:DinB family protein [Chloroflexota bacterium]